MDGGPVVSPGPVTVYAPVTATLTPTSVLAGGCATLTVTAAAGATAGLYLVTVTGAADGLTHSTVVPVTVTAAGSGTSTGGDFSVSADPDTLTVPAGQTATVIVPVASIGGFSGGVSLSLQGDLTGTFTPSLVPIVPDEDAESVLTVDTTGASLGDHYLTVQGQSGGTAHSAPVRITVADPAASGFSLSVSASTLTVPPGSGASAAVTVIPFGGFTGSVALSVSGNPAGVTCSLQPASLSVTGPGAQSGTLSIGVASTVLPGTYYLTVTGTSASASQETALVLIVGAAAAGSHSVNPSSPTVCSGNLQQFTGVSSDPAATVVLWLADIGTVNGLGLYFPPPYGCVDTVTAVFSDGATAEATVTVQIPTVTVASLSAYPAPANVGDSVSFYGPASSSCGDGYDESGDSFTYTWDFGDGSDPVTTSVPSASHAYGDVSPDGGYTVTLTVTDAYGGIGTRTVQQEVDDPSTRVTVHTGGWSPDEVAVTDPVTSSASATDSRPPAAPPGHTVTPHWTWTTDTVYRSDTGDGGTFTPYTGDYVISWVPPGGDDTRPDVGFTGSFGDPGYYLVQVDASVRYHDDTAGGDIDSASGTGYLAGSASDIQGGPGPQPQAQPKAKPHITVKGIGGPIVGDTSDVRYYCDGSAPKITLSAASNQPPDVTYTWTATGPIQLSSTTGKTVTITTTDPIPAGTTRPETAGTATVTLTYSSKSKKATISKSVPFIVRKPFAVVVATVDDMKAAGHNEQPAYGPVNILTFKSFYYSYGFTAQYIWWKLTDQSGAGMSGLEFYESFGPATETSNNPATGKPYPQQGHTWTGPPAGIPWTSGINGVANFADPYSLQFFGQEAPSNAIDPGIQEIDPSQLPMTVGTIVQTFSAGGCTLNHYTVTYSTNGAKHGP